jgi:DNA helicase-2/ATP-dependent DNA helicase PcrA
MPMCLKYQHRFKFILVDEYQIQILPSTKLLDAFRRARQYYHCGDAQSIYRWRGAEIENILKFESDFDKCSVLSWRRTTVNQKFITADDVIKNNKRQLQKTLFTKNHEGDDVELTEVLSDRDEGQLIVK